MVRIPYVVIGAGIVGLQTAYHLLKAGVAADDIVIFEKNIFPGEHSTSRNSGVLHAGLYYPAESLKQKFCLEGNAMWDEIARELGISLIRPGKYVVATTDDEIFELEKLFDFAKEKGVPGLEYCSPEKIKEFVHVKKAFFSKSTGVVSVSEAIGKLKDHLFMKGVPLMLSQEVVELEKVSTGFEFKVGEDVMEAGTVINCAGLFAPEIRKQLRLVDIENYWVKGRYLKLNRKFFNEALIYPLPHKGLTGLGVHTSFDLDGIIRFGPDTKEVDQIDYRVEDEALEQMFPAIEKTFKGIALSDLSPDYAGIRSKILRNGELYSDFWIESPIKDYFECLGIESPGLTASPAIAKYIVNRIIG